MSRIIYFVLVVTSTLFCSKKNSVSSNSVQPIWIAHALGGYNGINYLNCLECFENNYKIGFRYFEMDFMTSVEGYLVGMHDGQERNFGLNKEFTIDEFKKSSNQHTTPIYDEQIAQMMIEKPDWYLITDIKTDNLKGLRRICDILFKAEINCLHRVIPQFYHPSEFEIMSELKFERTVFTLYKFGNRFDEVKKVLKDNANLWAITMPAAWWDDNYKAIVSTYERIAFVHTVNDRSEADRLLTSGVNGIYTDQLYY